MKIPELLKNRTFVTFCFACALIVLFVISQMSSCYHELKVKRKVERQQSETAAEIRHAETEKTNADSAAAERKAEDETRNSEILPELHAARTRAASAKQTAAKSANKYEKSKIPSNSDLSSDPSSDLLRRERICADFAELYPDTAIEGCR